MRKTLAEIAEIINGEVVGDKNLIITGLSGIKEAQKGTLTFVANSKYYTLVEKTKASAIIAPRDMSVPEKSIIRTNDPSLAFAQIASYTMEDEFHPVEGIHSKAVIADDATIGEDVCIGAGAIIESKTKIGNNTTVYGGTYIGHQTTIGADCLIYPNVTIRERISIGNRVTIHSGTVVGSDGFGFADVEGVHQKIPQIGTVVIEDDVDIGANVTIDRARFDKTVIGKGTKIDNLVQIAHNVHIGENCIIVSQVGISGSSILGNNVILAGQAGVTGHLTIGEGSIVASKCGVTKSIPANSKVSGFPSRPHDLVKKIFGYSQRLPLYVAAIKELQKRVEELEKKLKKKKNG